MSFIRSTRALRLLEVLLWLSAGSWLVAGAGIGLVDYRSQEQRVAAFIAPATGAGTPSGPQPAGVGVVSEGQSDWSALRRSAWLEARSAGSDLPMAVLEIPELDIQAEIFPGTSDRALDLGIGHIEGTASPGRAGNVGLAGHRDGYFRRLAGVQVGQEIRIRTADSQYGYRVTSVDVVLPEDTHVLDDSDGEIVTLVTCYPFYFLGNAPQRFIVRATRSGNSFSPTPKPPTPKEVT